MPSVTKRRPYSQAFCRDVFLIGCLLQVNAVGHSMVFRSGHCKIKYLFLTGPHDANITGWIFWVFQMAARVLHGSSLYLIPDHGNFLRTNILKGSVSMCLRLGGNFNYQLTITSLISVWHLFRTQCIFADCQFSLCCHRARSKVWHQNFKRSCYITFIMSGFGYFLIRSLVLVKLP